FAPHVLSRSAGGIVPALIPFRGADDDADELRAALAEADPHVIVVFRPEALPVGAMDGIDVPVLGVITEPLPRADRNPHPNYDYNLAELRRLDRGNVDRVACVDPNSWTAAAAVVPIWRALPLPVDDRFYRAPTPSRRPPRIVFIGHSTMHREESLVSLKHEFDLPHYAHALMGDELREVLHGADVGLNVHGEQWVRLFEHSVLLHLAAGQLVVTEVLEPLYGLEPGIDVLQVSDRYELNLRVHQLMQMPDMHDRIRIRGHHKSRQFAASKVWPRVIGDLFADVAAFGTERQVGAATVR
ncbi:hypothetical protein, partial [Baekduia sp.]|uniref:hypothetical protein n=1 Tax=Baekduia sp. TaxID=2600305 RepID=UPI002DFED5FA|nr:hypothetical protein [Baekduia sp.]